MLGRKIPLYDDDGNVVGILGASVDITDRKRAEQELQEREILYRTLFENLPIPVFTKDRYGRYTSCNAEQLKYWEKNPIGHTDHELLPAEIADAFRAVDLQVMETRKPFFGEEKISTESGYRYSLVRKVPLYDAAGHLIGIQGAGIDITERRQAEKKLRETEQFAQSTIDALTAHICVLDETGVILSVNQAWHEFAEANPPVPPDHFVGDNYLTVCDAAEGEDSSEAAIFASGLRAVLQNERDQFSLEYPCNVPDGEKRWFIARITRFSIGDATRVVVAHENISIRKMAEEALRESEMRFSTVFHSSPLSIALTRLSDDKLVAVNKAWLESTEYSLKEAIEYSPQELNVWSANEQRDKFIQQLIHQGRQQGVELQLRKKSGETSDVLLSAELIELSGESHMLSMALDISDRKRSEKKIKQQLDRLTALSEIDRMIASSFDLSLTLNELIRQVIRQLEVDAAAVLLANPFTNTLEYVAGDGFHTPAIKYLKLRAGEGYAGKAALERSMVHLPESGNGRSALCPDISDRKRKTL